MSKQTKPDPREPEWQALDVLYDAAKGLSTRAFTYWDVRVAALKYAVEVLRWQGLHEAADKLNTLIKTSM